MKLCKKNNIFLFSVIIRIFISFTPLLNIAEVAQSDFLAFKQLGIQKD